jgi:hypothetical protein
VPASDRDKHLVQHIAHHGRADLVADHDDFRPAIDDPDRRFFLNALPDFPVLAKELNGFFLAI